MPLRSEQQVSAVTSRVEKPMEVVVFKKKHRFSSDLWGFFLGCHVLGDPANMTR